ncbi:hypothetical protein RvY_08886 [Ramazzottius varieornatus]|uniref:UBX domain-containing protein n=1 Tax=Ramazzottius varieornatus TaxID=947166 RepID=A0A1D1V9M0_RAMVA|nr:hypothetical protein RvY_08886 [Ramazzottius varieornatus]
MDIESMLVDDSTDIVFLVHYGDHTVRVELPREKTVGSLKMVLTRKTGLSGDDMDLLGWDAPAVADEMTFEEMGIEKEYNLILLAKNGSEDDRDKTSMTYHIQMEDEENDETFNLYFNGLQTVQDVKGHAATLSPIPVDRQRWDGWPWPISDHQSLMEVGLKTPTHKLRLNRIRDIVRPLGSNNARSNYLDTDNITEDEDDTEDDLEAVASASPSLAAQRGSLIPDVTLPIGAAVDLFVQNFEQRYGDKHVSFFVGALKDAMSFAFDRPITDRQLLVIYLHHDRSISVNIFVTQILQSPLIIEHVTDRVVVWPWDVTADDNKKIVRREIEQALGVDGGIPLSSIADQYPFMLICAKMKGSVELLRTIDGSKTASEVLHALEYADGVQSRAKAIEVSEQEARNRNRIMVEEQNVAYQKSLEADQAKAEAKRLLEQQAQLAENDARELIRRRERRQEEAAASLPPEPSQANGDPITIIRLKTPDGKNLTRRFSSNEPLKQLYKFALANGFPQEEFKLVCSFPRKDLGELDQHKSLKELGLTQQIALFVEEN